MNADSIVRILTQIDAGAGPYFRRLIFDEADRFVDYYRSKRKPADKRVYILLTRTNHWVALLIDGHRRYFVDGLGRDPTAGDYGPRVAEFVGSDPCWRLRRAFQGPGEAVCGNWILYFVFYFVRNINPDLVHVPDSSEELMRWWARRYGKMGT